MPRKKAPPLQYARGQQDMVAAAAISCPTCGGPWKSAKRVCRHCGQPIGSRHRWRMIPAGPGLWAIEHRNCDDPTKSEPPKPAISIGYTPPGIPMHAPEDP